MANPTRIALTDSQRAELTEISQSRSLPAGYVFRAKLILMLAKGLSFNAIKQRLQTTAPTIIRWKERFLTRGTDGLDTFHPGQKPTVLTPALRAKILAATRKKPTDGSTQLELPQIISRARRQQGCRASSLEGGGPQAHRIERYTASNDPEFEAKAADIIGLYLNPPQHAAVFCVDEKTAIQALDRLDPVLPLSPGRAERHGFEYYRHGTLSLYAALDTRTGKVLGKTAARCISKEFVGFLSEVVDQRSARQQIHIILDNLSAHNTQAVRDFLAAHPNVQLHFTPTYSSWLNQVELWFSKIERDVIARGVFTSPLKPKAMLRRRCLAGLGYCATATPRLSVPLSPMLHQQPVESHPLGRQVCKPPSQNLHLIVILPKLGVPKPFFQPETLVDDFIKLPPKPLALMAGFAQGFSLYLFGVGHVLRRGN